MLNLQKEFYRSVHVKHDDEESDISLDPSNLLKKHFETLRLNYYTKSSNLYTNLPSKISDFEHIEPEELYSKTFGFYDT